MHKIEYQEKRSGFMTILGGLISIVVEATVVVVGCITAVEIKNHIKQAMAQKEGDKNANR